MTLTEFLLARIAEDEAVAQEVEAKVRRIDEHYYEDARGSAPSAYFDLDYRQGGFTITAARVLAECEAKRRIIALHAPIDGAQVPTCGCCGMYGEGDIDWPCNTLKALALPYADHPDYDEEWRP